MTKRGMKPQQAAIFNTMNGVEMTKLKKIRVSKGYSQSELAAISGIPITRIQHYEQQTRPIDSARIETLCDLCLALDCKIEDLLESKDIITKLRMIK